MLTVVRPWLRKIGGVLALGLLAVGCAGDDGPSETAASSVVFRCPAGATADTVEVELRLEPDTAFVTLPEGTKPRTRGLTPVRAASGARYRGDDVVVWNKGEEARVEVDGETLSGCTRSPRRSVWREARRRGVVVRGVGQEPGWVLEVRPDRLHFSGDYGQRTVTVPRSAVAVDSTAERTVYRADRVRAVVEADPCTDIMSGEAFSHTVTVTVDGDRYRGCGRVLR